MAKKGKTIVAFVQVSFYIWVIFFAHLKRVVFLSIKSQVLGHLVTYSILAYLIAALIVYFRLLPSARDRKDQLVRYPSNRPKKLI